MKLRPLKVIEVNQYIKNMLSRDPILSRIAVEGEISNLKLHSSSHAYFTLKEGDARISCVMFNATETLRSLTLEDGHQVICQGSISIYERDGKYQLYVKSIEKKGLGALYEQFEAMKTALDQMGYFALERKKPIPTYPKKVVMITSPTGAVIRDMLKVSGRRNHYTDICLIPCAVQGVNAAQEIATAIERANAMTDVDVIILARGGGSMEELWAFNERPVADAIFKSDIPIVSAVGHETDFTLADFVADLRAATPSEAAERVFFDSRLLRREVDSLAYLTQRALEKKLQSLENIIYQHNPHKIYGKINSELDHKRLSLDYLFDQLETKMKRQLNQKTVVLDQLGTSLEALSPLKTLHRGYAIATTEEGRVIRHVAGVKLGDHVSIKVNDGVLKTVVEDIQKES